MEKKTAYGEYRDATGVKNPYKYVYSEYNSVEDACTALSNNAVLKLINRIAKTDASNTARAKVKSENDKRLLRQFAEWKAQQAQQA